MGCAASKAVPPPPTVTEPVPKPIAFEIPIEESAVKKSPPQKLKRLLEEPNHNNMPTAEEISEKQQKAEERRLMNLEGKIRTAQKTQKVFQKNGAKNNDDGAEEEKENQAC